MRIREEELDELYMVLIDMLNENFDSTLDRISNVSSQIVEKVERLLEVGDVE